MIKNITFIFISCLVITMTTAKAVYQESSLEIGPAHTVYYKYQEAREGKETVILLNGLIYATKNWDKYFEAMAAQGYGVLLLAYSTQPESLRLLTEAPFYAKPTFGPYGPNQQGLEVQTFVDETISVVDHLSIERFTLLSLSYGSIVASNMAIQYKDRINQLILSAPAVMPSNRYFPIGQSRYDFFFNLKQSSPLPGLADYLYDAEFYTTLATTVTAATYKFPGVEFNDFFHGIFQMARSTKWFDLKDYANEVFPPTYLFVASEEETELKKDQLLFWNLMSSNESRRSIVTFRDSPHAITGAKPLKAAAMTINVIEGNLNKEQYRVD